MDLLYLIDRLEEQVAGAQRMPIGNRAVIDRRDLLDTIDQLRIAVPGEVRDAREIVAEMDAIRRNTEEEARLMIARAEEQAASLVEAHKVTRAAHERADELVAEAEARAAQRDSGANAEMSQRIEESRLVARQQVEAADEYARELLAKLDQQLGSFQRSVRAGLEQLADAAPPDDPAPAAAAPPVTPDQMEHFLAEAAAAPRSLDEAERRATGAPAPPALPAEDEDGVIDDFALPSLDDERPLPDASAQPATRNEAGAPQPAPIPEREPAAPTNGRS